MIELCFEMYTTRFHSFTDGNIPSVCDWEFVGKLFTDYITNGIRSSAYLSSVIPHFVAISVKKTKKSFADGFTDGICVSKKKSHLKYFDGLKSVGDIVSYRRTVTIGKFVGDCLKYWPNISVCKFVGTFGSYCQMPTD